MMFWFLSVTVLRVSTWSLLLFGVVTCDNKSYVFITAKSGESFMIGVLKCGLLG